MPKIGRLDQIFYEVSEIFRPRFHRPVGFEAVVHSIESGSKTPESHAGAPLPSCNTTSRVGMKLWRRTP